MSTRVNVPQDVLDAIATVRNDKSPANFLVVGHAGDSPNELQLEAMGDGGFAELFSKLRSDACQYVLCMFLLPIVAPN